MKGLDIETSPDGDHKSATDGKERLLLGNLYAGG